ncbi:MAG: ABC transporter ATP-binding protein [Polyangiaceae bacterium]|nr:ABC transporter ATP-binding protein [Polyangiaceae bacterium]
MSTPLLSVRDLRISFDTPRGTVHAVEKLSFDVPRNSCVALVGESGCGKSITTLSILGLVPEPGRVSEGQILFDGTDLRQLSDKQMRSVRGDQISMIFQEPMTSLNPVYTIGSQISEAIRIHRKLSRRAARAQALELLEAVQIPAPAERIDAYPHQLSGGMRQRVLIAMALACDPTLLLADEPTTALDVTVQAQILDLLGSLQKDREMSLLFVTHDLGVVAEFAQYVVVMYAGQVVETGTVDDIFSRASHPYTQALLRSMPRAGQKRGGRLLAIPGAVPDLANLPEGCRFAERCQRRKEVNAERCATPPDLDSLPGAAEAAPYPRQARCHFPPATDTAETSS